MLQQADFQIIFFIPTTNDLGIMALNHSFSNNVFPLGVVNKYTHTDGLNLSPPDFFQHDTAHSASFLSFENKYKERLMGKNYQRVQRMDLSLEEREMVETVYFLMVHESDYRDHPSLLLNKLSSSNKKFTTLKRLLSIDLSDDYYVKKRNIFRLRFSNTNNLGNLLPSSVNPANLDEIQEYLDESVKVFKRVTRQAQLGL